MSLCTYTLHLVNVRRDQQHQHQQHEQHQQHQQHQQQHQQQQQQQHQHKAHAGCTLWVIFCCAFMWSTRVEHAAAGSAQRRRERRLRAWLRHERMTVAMALAESQHHTALRGQMTARARGGAREVLHGRAPGEAPPPGGWHPVFLHGG